ncbi:MAG TPA: DUF998 domain-containing protein [Gemmatimonadales bacterium]|nr:DUF998 domain-containing protein [Gemmatimonadales bacterium]
MLRKALLVAGVASSLLYVGIDLLAAVRYGAYHSFTSRAISELGAIGAPTKQLVDPLFIVYGVLLIAFALGVWSSAGGRRLLQAIGALLIGISVVGWLTPSMHLRGTAGVSGDLPHIVGTGVIVLFILAAIALGALLYGRRFRFYSWATLVILVLSGALTGIAAGHLAAGQPTPWLGLAERINIYGYLLWVGVLAVTLLRKDAGQSAREPISGRSADSTALRRERLMATH